MGKILKKWASYILLVVFVFCVQQRLIFANDSLPEKTTKTIRVAYPLQKGLTDIDSNGNYCGYTYEYLEEIAQYTGWNYEFVQAEGDLNNQLAVLMDMVERGEVDIMGATLYSEALGEKYNYSSHSYGVVETALQVPIDDIDRIEINSQVQQTIRIAVQSIGMRETQELKDYCRMNLIDPVFVMCKSREEQMQALKDGRADAMLNSNLDYVEGVRSIAKFSPKPFYFIMPKDAEPELAAELNQAILDIDQADPYLAASLFEKYFAGSASEFVLSHGEKEFIKNSGPVRVWIANNHPPFQYYNEASGEYMGISIELLNIISEKTGLEFEFYNIGDSGDLQQEYDMVAGVTYEYSSARAQNLAMTRPYVSCQYILATTAEHMTENVVGKRLALSKDYVLYGNTPLGNIIVYESIEDCLSAISRGEADYTYLDAYTAQYYVNMSQYKSLKLIPQTINPRNVSFGLVKPVSRELLSILNKAIRTMPIEEIQAIVNSNTIVAKPQMVSEAVRNIMITLLLLLMLLMAGFCAYYISMSRSDKKLRAAKAQAEDAYKKAEKASLAKSEFLSRMSHEIRTPMNGISGMTAIALNNIDDRERVQDCLSKVRLSSEHLLRIINDILDMAKIESGKIEFRNEEFDFSAFLDDLSGIYYGQAEKKGLKYETVLMGGIGGKLIGDSLRLNQILGNLLSNACKFTPEGGTVRLVVSRLFRAGERIWIRFEVSDTGCGIHSENLDVIFNSFEQGNGVAARAGGGTGLGLSIVRHFAEAMGGRVFVSSSVGKGSTFTVELPFEKLSKTAENAEKAEAEEDEEGQDKVHDFAGRRILLAEDNELNMEIAMELIGMTGATLESASDGLEAVKLFAASPEGYYDLILMDIQMPNMDGYEATREIRSMQRADAATVPIYAITADAFAQDREKCIAEGMNGHISKPIEINSIYVKLNDIFQNNRHK